MIDQSGQSSASSAQQQSTLSNAPHFWRRLVALLIDGLVSFGFGLPITLWLWLDGSINIDGFPHEFSMTYRLPQLLFAGFLMIVYIFFLYLWMVQKHGGTIGKRVMGLTIVDIETGKFPTYKQGFIRYLISFVSGFFGSFAQITLFYHRERRSLADLAAKTKVLDMAHVRPQPKNRYILATFLLLAITAPSLYSFVTNPSQMFQYFRWDSENEAMIFEIKKSKTMNAFKELNLDSSKDGDLELSKLSELDLDAAPGDDFTPEQLEQCTSKFNEIESLPKEFDKERFCKCAIGNIAKGFEKLGLEISLGNMSALIKVTMHLQRLCSCHQGLEKDVLGNECKVSEAQ